MLSQLLQLQQYMHTCLQFACACLLAVCVQVEAITQLTVLALARNTFLSVLGPLEELMKREKSPQVSTRPAVQQHAAIYN